MHILETNRITIFQNYLMILETERLFLRTWKAEDIEPMTIINKDPKVRKFLPSIGNRSMTESMIERFIKHYREYGFCLYAVEHKTTHKLLGFVGLNIPSFAAHFTPAVEIGWRLASQYWNKGFATEAAKAVLKHAFTNLGLNKIVSFTVVGNRQSRRVMEKIGLHHDAKDDFDHPKIDKNSPFCHHVLYRLTKQQYFNKR